MNFVGLSKLVYFSFYSPQTLGGINILVNIRYLSNEAITVPIRPESPNFIPYKNG